MPSVGRSGCGRIGVVIDAMVYARSATTFEHGISSCSLPNALLSSLTRQTGMWALQTRRWALSVSAKARVMSLLVVGRLSGITLRLGWSAKFALQSRHAKYSIFEIQGFGSSQINCLHFDFPHDYLVFEQTYVHYSILPLVTTCKIKESHAIILSLFSVLSMCCLPGSWCC